jgi:cytoskeleton protein RodZ
VNTDARVILRAVADCWIEIKDESGSEVFTRLLRAGEIYKVPNRTDLRLRMGNAGGLEVIVDGTVLPPLGGHGEVMRNVSLDPAVLAASL